MRDPIGALRDMRDADGKPNYKPESIQAAIDIILKLRPITEVIQGATRQVQKELIKAFARSDRSDLPAELLLSMPELLNEIKSMDELATLYLKTKSTLVETAMVNHIKSDDYPSYHDSASFNSEAVTPNVYAAILAKPADKRRKLATYLRPVDRRGLISDMEKEAITEAKEAETEMRNQVKNGERKLELARFLPPDDPFFDNCYKEIRSGFSGTGRGDKMKAQRNLPFMDIQQALANFWPRNSAMNRSSFLAHPDLPADKIIEALRIWGDYYRNPRARKFELRIRAKITWDLLRRAADGGVNCWVFEHIPEVSGGEPMTETELKTWFFPAIVKAGGTGDKILKEAGFHRLCLMHPGFSSFSQALPGTGEVTQWLDFFEPDSRPLETARRMLSLTKESTAEEYLEVWKMTNKHDPAFDKLDLSSDYPSLKVSKEKEY